jgi:hypothetical protein
MFQPVLPHRIFYALLSVGVLTLLVGVSLGPIHVGPVRNMSADAMQTTRVLALAMFEYANDNNAYPDGKSSTEVFQKLIDGNYVTDPGLFYAAMPGKTKSLTSHLRPENVSYDVTSGIQMNSPDNLPIVFLTGFRIDYRPGGTAVSLIRPFPNLRGDASNWLQSLTGGPLEPVSGLPVTYKSNNLYFRVGQIGADGMGVVPNVIPPDFDARGQTYRQLTPEGVLK